MNPETVVDPTTGTVAVLLVSVATIAIGSVGLRLSRTTSDFYVASRAVSAPWNASAIGGEYLSAASFLGVAGLVMQSVDGEALPEIGYLLHHPWWKKGLATEAACAVRDWAYEVRRYTRLVSLIRPVNSPSRRVAERVGMRRWKESTHAGLTHDVYAIERVDVP